MRRGTAAIQHTQDMARALLAHVQAGTPEPRSIAAHLLALRDPTRAGEPPLAGARLQSELLVFFLAGSETTGHTIAWTRARPPPQDPCFRAQACSGTYACRKAVVISCCPEQSRQAVAREAELDEAGRLSVKNLKP